MINEIEKIEDKSLDISDLLSEYFSKNILNNEKYINANTSNLEDIAIIISAVTNFCNQLIITISNNYSEGNFALVTTILVTGIINNIKQTHQLSRKLDS